MSRSRQKVVDLIASWVGKNEADGSFKSIIDIYNKYNRPLPRATKMQYDWPWCACTWSAVAITLDYTDIMPIEISCEELINRAKALGCWKESDAYVAKPGDGILYDWDDDGSGDNTGWADHIGTVIETNSDAGYFVVVEGNYSNAVKKRTLSINGRYIRGFIAPKYTENKVVYNVRVPCKDVNTVAREVIAGSWGSGAARKEALEVAGYDYTVVQNMVNQILNGSAVKPSTPIQNQSQQATKLVRATCAAQKFKGALATTYKTTADLYMRNDAGTNKKALCIIPKGTKVHCYGYYSVANGVNWLYIEVVLDGVKYTGFSSSVYLKK